MAKKPLENGEIENGDDTAASALKPADAAGEASVNPAPEPEASHTPPPLSDEARVALKKMAGGTFTYLGATTSFNCRAGKEWTLIRGKTYSAAALPEHEIIANLFIKRLLVRPEKTEA